jgi:hypothetical protein
MQRTRTSAQALLILLLLIFSATLAVQKPGKKHAGGNAANLLAVIWRNADNVSSLNLIYGAGGQAHGRMRMAGTRLSKEDMAGHSVKFEVKDAQGVLWKA